MDLLPKIRAVIESNPDSEQLDKFISDVREGLSASGKQFIAFQLAAITGLVFHYMFFYEGAKAANFQGLPITDSPMLQKAFLVIPSALLCASASIGFLRRCQRELYDFLSISRFRVVGQTGLHELRLPSDYILGLFYLKTEGGLAGKLLFFLVGLPFAVTFTVAPSVYIAHSVGENLARFGLSDPVVLAAGVVAFILSAASLAIAVLAERIKPCCPAIRSSGEKPCLTLVDTQSV